MNGTNLKLVRAAFGALVLGSLGFGVSQAFASSTAAAAAGFCTAHQLQACMDNCRDEGKSNARCRIDAGQPVCQCF